MKPACIAIVAAALLGGCQVSEDTGHRLVPGNPMERVLLGQVPGGVPAEFHDDALHHATQAVARYVEVSDLITTLGGVDPEPMRVLVSPHWWSSEVAGFEYFSQQRVRTLGQSAVSSILLQSARTTPDGITEVGVIACVDTTSLFVLQHDTPDPPAEVWQWHPHYEDFAGEPSSWLAIEAFLETPGVSWGSHEAVVFWFEGAHLSSLVLVGSEPWWGVYSCT
jgi:hypothetical protein